jgi:hypothetical protein
MQAVPLTRRFSSSPEHFLDYLRELGLAHDLVFKGGTSLRKFVFGLQGASPWTWIFRSVTVVSASS